MMAMIECRRCESPYCDGCNIYTLSKMLLEGELNCLMGDNHSIARTPESLRAKWISVEDRPPEENARVWVFCDGKTEVMIYRRDANGECRFYWEDELGLLSAWYKYRVTHWMPLPEPPKE